MRLNGCSAIIVSSRRRSDATSSGVSSKSNPAWPQNSRIISMMSRFGRPATLMVRTTVTRGLLVKRRQDQSDDRHRDDQPSEMRLPALRPSRGGDPTKDGGEDQKGEG